jgi:hypothetical protein
MTVELAGSVSQAPFGEESEADRGSEVRDQDRWIGGRKDRRPENRVVSHMQPAGSSAGSESRSRWSAFKALTRASCSR